MPATVLKNPLGIRCLFSDGSTAQFDMDGLPCRGLVEDLLVGLVELIHPHGRMDAAGSVDHYILAFREMARKLGATSFSARAADLRRPQLIEYWMGTTGPREACTRRALEAFGQNGGTLHPSVVELAAGRNFNPLPYRKPLPPYREAEWDRLTATCVEITSSAFAAHKRALANSAHGVHTGEGGWTSENLAWLLSRVGPVGATGFGQLVGCSQQIVLKRGGFLETSAALFPPLDVSRSKIGFGSLTCKFRLRGDTTITAVSPAKSAVAPLRSALARRTGGRPKALIWIPNGRRRRSSEPVLILVTVPACVFHRSDYGVGTI